MVVCWARSILPKVLLARSKQKGCPVASDQKHLGLWPYLKGRVFAEVTSRRVSLSGDLFMFGLTKRPF